MIDYTHSKIKKFCTEVKVNREINNYIKNFGIILFQYNQSQLKGGITDHPIPWVFY